MFIRMLSAALIAAAVWGEAAYAADPFLIDIKVQQQLPQSQQWLVTYKFSKPISKAIFIRDINLFRHDHWAVQTPNVELVVSDDQEEFVSKDGSKFDSVVVSLESYFAATPKDYEFFLPFTDGSQAMYTGHYNVYPPEFVTEDSYGSDSLKITFSFESTNNHIFFLGNGHFERATWPDPDGAGTYVYFGEIQPLQTDLFVGIIDPGLPPWLKATLFDSIPKIFSEYTESLNFRHTGRPMVFFNYQKQSDGVGSGGGVLPGVVSLQIEGKDWENESSGLRESIVFLIAHEAAHLWNSLQFNYSGEKNSFWMHEGGANALAFRASYRLGIYGLERLNEIFSKELNECIEMIGAHALNEASKLKLFKAYYSCGSTIGLIAEAAARRTRTGFTAMDFWSELFTRSLQTRNIYNQEMFFDVLESLSNDPALTVALKTFVNSGVASPKVFFVNILKSLGVRVDEDAKTGKLTVRDYSYN